MNHLNECEVEGGSLELVYDHFLSSIILHRISLAYYLIHLLQNEMHSCALLHIVVLII